MVMWDKYIISLLVFLFLRNTCANHISVQDERSLPRMYEMDNYERCKKMQGRYCRVDIHLSPLEINSTLAREIKKSIEDRNKYDRSNFHRLICVPPNIIDSNLIKEYASKAAQEYFNDISANLDIIDIRCEPNKKFEKFDLIVCLLLIGYFVLVIIASLYDAQRERRAENSKQEDWFLTFSIFENWKKINAKNSNPDYQKLKSIQGIRFFNTVMMIAWHTKNSFVLAYIDDVSTWENILANPLMLFSMHLDLLIVQTYYMISSLLLTNQIHEIYKNQGYFSLRHCVILYINRMFRFLPTILIQILVSTSLAKFWCSPHTMESFFLIFDNCLNAWWATLFHFNYILPFHKMCQPGTWYLSVDTCLFISTLMTMYIALKYSINIRKLSTAAFFSFVGIYGIVIHVNNLDTMYKAYPKLFKKLLTAPEFNTLYINPFSNWSTSFLGIGLGSIYHNTKNLKSISIPEWHRWLAWTVFFTVPIAIVYITTVEFEGMSRAILGALLKPMFALPFGIGILLMSRGYGDIVDDK
ncbi:O-acyltransferase like protein-like isoform X2 [Cylas formicarius]|uniref:O-acyltransferase like protein-like isoform X2 n=1 Tax=Cylas formicarius TaxID=197179 RepID=UPI0029585A93|nr:O-acyltransferase like protein-like isoform X2 [Cylas formicarius]